jgi:hypothetical protein
MTFDRYQPGDRWSASEENAKAELLERMMRHGGGGYGTEGQNVPIPESEDWFWAMLTGINTVGSNASGSITGIDTSGSNMKVASAAHGLVTGQTIFIDGVQGLTGAEGIWQVTVNDAGHFTLNNSGVGTGAYTTGGKWVTSTFNQYSWIRLWESGVYSDNTGQSTATPQFSWDPGLAFGTFNYFPAYELNNEVVTTPTKSGTITLATNANPIQITSAAHGLLTGNLIAVYGVGGLVAANGMWVITKIDANNFTLNNSFGIGSGTYTTGSGQWVTMDGKRVRLVPGLGGEYFVFDKTPSFTARPLVTGINNAVSVLANTTTAISLTAQCNGNGTTLFITLGTISYSWSVNTCYEWHASLFFTATGAAPAATDFVQIILSDDAIGFFDSAQAGFIHQTNWGTGQNFASGNNYWANPHLFGTLEEIGSGSRTIQLFVRSTVAGYVDLPVITAPDTTGVANSGAAKILFREAGNGV